MQGSQCREILKGKFDVPILKVSCACVQVSLCGIHRDPVVWGNPDEFVPERWVAGAPEEATEAQKRSWMPFGDGIRACVGKRFAWEEAIIALTRIYQKCAVTFLTNSASINLELSHVDVACGVSARQCACISSLAVKGFLNEMLWVQGM